MLTFSFRACLVLPFHVFYLVATFDFYNWHLPHHTMKFIKDIIYKMQTKKTLKDMVKKGFLSKDGNLYKITERGRQHLKSIPPTE